MTTTYHTPIATGAAANAATFNTPFSQLDSRLVQLDNAVDTDGSLRAGAVDDTGILVDNVVTNAKIADATIAGGKLENGTITATQIADTTITGGKVANATITDAKLAKPVRIAWAYITISDVLSSISAHSVSDTEWDLGLTEATYQVVVNRMEILGSTNTTPGVIWDGWIISPSCNLLLRGTNVTANTVNVAAPTNLWVGIYDVIGSLGETTESLAE